MPDFTSGKLTRSSIQPETTLPSPLATLLPKVISPKIKAVRDTLRTNLYSSVVSENITSEQIISNPAPRPASS